MTVICPLADSYISAAARDARAAAELAASRKEVKYADLDGRYMFAPIAFIARVHSVHVMNVEQRQAAADPHLTWAARPPVYESIFYVSYYFALLLRKVICCINFIRLAVFRCYATKGLTEA